MAHDVKFTVPERELGNSDIQFDVRIDGGKLGTLKVSKGALVWIPANKQSGYQLTWQKLNELAQQEGRVMK